MRFKTLCGFSAVGLMVGMAACSAGDDGQTGTFNGTGSPTTNGVGGGVTGPGSGGAGGTTAMGGQAVSIGTGSGGEEVCESTDVDAVPKTLNMIVVLDRSGSMGSIWTDATSALTQFFQDPANVGINAALNFFPVDPTSSDQCMAGLHNPPQNPLTDIPVNAQPLVDALNGTGPSGGTPTYPAIEGAAQWAVGYNQTHPGEVTIIVFVSDGQPGQCNTNDSQIAGLAGSAFNSGNPGVRTYALALPGIGSGLSTLDQIAAAGGTMQAIDISSNISLFKQKMDEIRSSALGCEYAIPPNPNGTFDATKANVNFDPGNGNMPTNYVNVADAASCGNTLGWYYDDPNNPTQILLCPAACQLVENAAMIPNSPARVVVAFGCPIIQG